MNKREREMWNKQLEENKKKINEIFKVFGYTPQTDIPTIKISVRDAFWGLAEGKIKKYLIAETEYKDYHYKKMINKKVKKIEEDFTELLTKIDKDNKVLREKNKFLIDWINKNIITQTKEKYIQEYSKNYESEKEPVVYHKEHFYTIEGFNQVAIFSPTSIYGEYFKKFKESIEGIK